MSEYKSDAAEDRRPSVTVTGAGQLTINQGKYTTTAALASADTVAMCKLPAGHVPVDLIVDTDDLDTNGTPTLTMKAGIIGGEDMIASSTLGQAAGMARMDSIAGRRIAPTDADRLVGLTVTANAATGVVGGVITATLLSRVAGLDD